MKDEQFDAILKTFLDNINAIVKYAAYDLRGREHEITKKKYECAELLQKVYLLGKKDDSINNDK